MTTDLVWSYAPLSAISWFFVNSILSLTELCRNEISIKYAKFIFFLTVISSSLVIYERIFKSAFYANWFVTALDLSIRLNALYLMWTTLTRYKIIVLIFENIKRVDNRLETLGHLTEHCKHRKYTIIAATSNVISVIIFYIFCPVNIFYNSLVLSYVLHANFVYILGIFFTMITNFCLLVLTVRHRMQVLEKCVTELKFTVQRNVSDISILSVIPPVECTGPQFSGCENENQHTKTVKTVCNELFGVLRVITNYYAFSFAWYIFNVILWYWSFGYVYSQVRHKNLFLCDVGLVVILSAYVCLGLLSCTLLETEISQVKLTIMNAMEVNADKSSRTLLKCMHWKLIHDDERISCGFLDFNLNLIPTIINLASTVCFAAIQK